MNVFEILSEAAPVGSTADLGLWHGGLRALLGDVVKKADGWYFADGTKLKDTDRIAQAEKIYAYWQQYAAGNQIDAPKKANTSTPSLKAKIHTVDKGETVYSIARSYAIEPTVLYKLNDFDNTTKLDVGQKVKVPAQAKFTKAEPKPTGDGYDISDWNKHEKYLYKEGRAIGMGDLELVAFISQSAHETEDFTRFTERASGRAYEPKFVKNPITKKISQTAGKAVGIGNTKVGDGPLFRGRGYLHLTGRWNYEEAARQLGDQEIFTNPKSVATSGKRAMTTAIWYWKRFVRPDVSDWSDNRAVSIEINGGTTGLTSRGKYFEEYKAKLAAAKTDTKEKKK
jgi:putative chitinase